MNARVKLPARLLILVSAALLCVACGPKLIKGRAPFISISGMSLVNERLSAEFDIRNHNDVPMKITMIDITVTVNDTELTRENRAFDLTVGANSAESVRVEDLPDDFTRALLASLEGGEVKSLPFDLNGRVNTVENGYLSFSHKGYLYPVPGRPGHFRSAVTQSEELKREDLY
jgi:LEA14-like dessication related protein